MSDVRQLLRKAILGGKTIRITLQNGDKLQGKAVRDQSLRFKSNDSTVRMKQASRRQGSTDKSKEISVSDITDVEIET